MLYIFNYRYIIKGRLGDSLIGFNAIEDFTSQKTKLIGYIQQNEFTYNKQIQEYVKTGRRLLYKSLCCSCESDGSLTYDWEVTKVNKIKKITNIKRDIKILLILLIMILLYKFFILNKNKGLLLLKI